MMLYLMPQSSMRILGDWPFPNTLIVLVETAATRLDSFGFANGKDSFW